MWKANVSSQQSLGRMNAGVKGQRLKVWGRRENYGLHANVFWQIKKKASVELERVHPVKIMNIL